MAGERAPSPEIRALDSSIPVAYILPTNEKSRTSSANWEERKIRNRGTIAKLLTPRDENCLVNQILSYFKLSKFLTAIAHPSLRRDMERKVVIEIE